MKITSTPTVTAVDETSGAILFQTAKQQVVTAYLEHQAGSPRIGAGNVPIPFVTVTAPRFLHLEADKDIRVVLNGAAPLQLRKGTGASYARFTFEGEITSLAFDYTITGDEAPAQVTYFLAGDTT